MCSFIFAWRSTLQPTRTKQLIKSINDWGSVLGMAALIYLVIQASCGEIDLIVARQDIYSKMLTIPVSQQDTWRNDDASSKRLGRKIYVSMAVADSFTGRDTNSIVYRICPHFSVIRSPPSSEMATLKRRRDLNPSWFNGSRCCGGYDDVHLPNATKD